ncbi:hypothetical protein [Phocaeicola barnesiae]|uniref:hypothetical protein n=1 Tax=Phocaeicola barnesiae TaxID=376804 RepID=UPI0026700B7B|nr:hypothetical protein [Phocaeicola barnesiae]
MDTKQGRSYCKVKGKMVGRGLLSKKILLYNEDLSQVLDVALIENMAFQFKVPAYEQKIYQLMYKCTEDDPFAILLPFVGGEGDVEVYVGPKVVTRGTPSNEALQDFLLARSNFQDDLLLSGISAEESKAAFKGFLKEQIQMNRKNIVSGYILKSFRSRFDESEYAYLLEQIDEQFRL